MPEHQGLEPGREDEGGDRVDELHLEQLDRGHLGEREAPAIVGAQVDLLLVGVERAAWEEVDAAGEGQILRGEGGLGEEGGVGARTAGAPLFVVGEERGARLLGERGDGLPLEVDEVRVEAGRPAHRLARVVEDEVEAVRARVEGVGEALHGGGEPQIEAVDLEAPAPRGRPSGSASGS